MKSKGEATLAVESLTTQHTKWIKMDKRLSMKKVYLEAYKAMAALDDLVDNASFERWFAEMIRIRSSYINGCAYCVDSHTQDALKLGIPARKIALVPVWREAGDIFSEKEQAILSLTEQVSLIHNHGIADDVYQTSIRLFGEKQTAELIMAIITINAWNRIGVGLRMKPTIE
jgi:AhpD family alkylhydroperoxidase